MTRGRREALLFAAALAVRVAHVLIVRPGPLFRYLFIDSQFYDGVGQRLASGQGFPEGPFFMNVLYGIVLGAVYAVFGSGDAGRLAVLLLQAAGGAWTCVLLARLGAALDRPRDGWVAGILLAVYGPAIFYDAVLLTPSLLLLLTVAVTLAAVRALGDGGRVRHAAGLGILTGLLVLGRASHVLLLAGWVAALAARGRAAGPRMAAMLAACAVCVLPVSVRNLAVSGEWIPVSANGGMALWAGNHEGATGIYSEPSFLTNPVPEREAEDYRAEASRRSGRALTLAGSSAFWTRETLRRWAAHPGSALRLAARKVRLFLHATESQTNLSYYFARDFSIVLQAFRLHFGWILPFAIVGAWEERRRFGPVFVPVAASLATCVLFYVSSEYRHPVVPCLLLCAAAGARHAAGILRTGRPVRRVAVAVILLATLVGSNLRDPFLARLASRRVDYYNFAALAAADGRLEEAERYARRSVAIDPEWAASRAKLAEILQRQGRVREASREGEAAASLGAATVPPDLAAATALFGEGRFAEAEAAFLALAAKGGGEERAVPLNDAGLCAMRSGNAARAESLLAAACDADSAYASPRIHLGRLALATGRPDAAAEWARKALALAPGDARAKRLLARATGEGAVPDAGADDAD